MAINPDDPDRSNLTDADIRRQARLDNELQPDPELAEGPASGGKVAMFAIAIAVVLGAVFYGLNNSTVNQAGTTPPTSTAQNTERTSPPTAPTGMRDVTPRTNSEPGTTTGASPARPQAPAAPAPEVNPPASPAPSK
jgi:hypothetical protein